MERIQIQRDMMNVFSVLQDLSVLILLPLQCPVKMAHLASLDPHSVPFAHQGTGKSLLIVNCILKRQKQINNKKRVLEGSYHVGSFSDLVKLWSLVKDSPST